MAGDCSADGGCGSQVVGDRDQIEVECVGGDACVAHAGEAVAAFQLGKGAFDRLPNMADQLVAHRLPSRQHLLVLVATMLDAILDAAGFEAWRRARFSYALSA